MRGLLEVYREHGVLDQDVDATLDVMREWYNGYRFAEDVEGDLYNTDMVLYYLCESVPNRSLPRDLIEVKYLKRRESLDESVVAEKMREAADQVRRYLEDENLRRRHPSVRHVGLAVVFHGWEMAACEAVGDGPEQVADVDE